VASGIAFITMSGASDVARLDAIKKTLDSVYKMLVAEKSADAIENYDDILCCIEQLLELQSRMFLHGTGVTFEPVDGNVLIDVYERMSDRFEECNIVAYQAASESDPSTCAIL
jgi:hypothetical protein